MLMGRGLEPNIIFKDFSDFISGFPVGHYFREHPVSALRRKVRR